MVNPSTRWPFGQVYDVSPFRMYLVRFVELGRDGQEARRGHRHDLVAEIQASLPGAEVQAETGRLFVTSTRDDARAILAALPGIASFSPCERLAIDDAPAAAADLARRALPAGGRYAVRVRSVGADHLPSRELTARVGRAVTARAPDLTVDLEHPDLTLGLEVRGPHAYLYTEVIDGTDRRGPAPAHTGAPRFLVDQMLGRLATWLRVLGHDVATGRDQPDSWLLRLARDEHRVLLTRDRALSRAASADTFFVVATDPDRQLLEVARAFHLDLSGAGLFTRCTRCNTPVRPISADLARGRVPPSIQGRVDTFTTCPSCQRIYWDGDHTARILARLSALRSAVE